MTVVSLISVHFEVCSCSQRLEGIMSISASCPTMKTCRTYIALMSRPKPHCSCACLQKLCMATNNAWLTCIAWHPANRCASLCPVP